MHKHNSQLSIKTEDYIGEDKIRTTVKRFRYVSLSVGNKKRLKEMVLKYP